MLLDPGDACAFEDPGCLMARRRVEATGSCLLPVTVDEQGLNTARLPEDRHVRLAGTTPSHQFPLGAMLPIGRRPHLLRWAARWPLCRVPCPLGRAGRGWAGMSSPVPAAPG